MENIYEILKQLPKGTMVYYAVLGSNFTVELSDNENNVFPIKLTHNKYSFSVNEFGQGVLNAPDAECMIFPSKDHRTWEDWREFYGISKPQPQFKPFDKVLVRDAYDQNWIASLFSHHEDNHYPYVTSSGSIWKKCIPYEGNEHLVGTTDSPND